MTNAKKKRIPIFWPCFTVFILALVSFWIYVLCYVNQCLVTYENAQPEYVIENLVQKIEEGNAESLFTFSATQNRFEDKDIAKNRFLESLSDKEITFEQDATSYNALAPTYVLYADGTKFASITLKETSSYPLMFILSVPSWEVAETVPVLDSPDNSVTLKVPDTYTAYINGIALKESELTGNSWDIESFVYASEYVTVPRLIEYQVSELFNAPNVAIKDAYGNTVAYTQTGNLIEVSEFVPIEMDSELSDYVLQNAIDYSNFFSKDLAGCRNSTKCISHMFPENSYYLELAENYRLHDMWMYSSHKTPSFSDQLVSEYVRYSEDFFSCRIYFQKHMELTRTGDLRTDITDSTFYYVKNGGNWVIADMKATVEE